MLEPRPVSDRVPTAGPAGGRHPFASLLVVALAATLALATALALIAAPAASAAYNDRAADRRDAAGDAASPYGGHDIVELGFAYLSTGVILARVDLREAPDPSAPAVLRIFAGTYSGRECAGNQLGFLSDVRSPSAVWKRVDVAPNPYEDSGSADKAGGLTAVQEFSAIERQFLGRYVECMYATTSDPQHPDVIYDTAGPFTMPRMASAAFSARFAGVPRTVRPSHTRTVRLRLRNRGVVSTGPIRLSVGTARGLTVSAPRTVRSVAPGSTRTVAVRVRLSPRASSRTRLRITASGTRGPKVTATTTLRRSRTG